VKQRRRLVGCLELSLQFFPASIERLDLGFAWLERQVADVDHDLDQTIEHSPAWRAKENLLRSVPACGH
jgi:hypothetical protein